MSLEQIISDEVDKVPFGAGKEPGEQGSVEWLMERVGHCTASSFYKVLNIKKNGEYGADHISYVWDVVVQRLTGNVTSNYTSEAMNHGLANEPLARMAYESATGAMVLETGFKKHPTIPFVGGSPDGVIEPDGGVEIKSPFNPRHHLQCYLTGMPDEHMAQIQGLMWIHDAKWWDFVSHCPSMPSELQIYIQRIERDDEYISNLEREVQKFLSEVAEIVAKLKG